MVPFNIFHEGIEKLLGRDVYTHEFGMNTEGLKREARVAIEKLGRGESLKQTPEYQSQKVEDAINSLTEFARKKGKTLIIQNGDEAFNVPPTPEEPVITGKTAADVILAERHVDKKERIL